MSKQIETLKIAIADAFIARKAKETAKNASNTNIQKNLDKYAKEVNHDAVITILAACNFSAESINSNVYAVEKMIATARYCASVDKLDIYTQATFASMIALEASQIEVTRDVIASFCTNDVKTKYDAKIKATRVQSCKSQSTVATQHNSTINAMKALHMITETVNASNDSVFTLNRDNVAVKKIAERQNVTL